MEQPQSSRPAMRRAFERTARAAVVVTAGLCATESQPQSVYETDDQYQISAQAHESKITPQQIAQKIQLENALQKFTAGEIDARELFNISEGILYFADPTVVDQVLQDGLARPETSKAIMPYLLYSNTLLTSLPNGDKIMETLLQKPEADAYVKYALQSVLENAPVWQDRFIQVLFEQQDQLLTKTMESADPMLWNRFITYVLNDTADRSKLLFGTPVLTQLLLDQVANRHPERFWRPEIFTLLTVHRIPPEQLERLITAVLAKPFDPLVAWSMYHWFALDMSATTRSIFESHLPAQPMTEVAVSLQNIQPKLDQLSADVTTFNVEAVPRSLVAPLVVGQTLDRSYWETIDAQLSRQSRDAYQQSYVQFALKKVATETGLPPIEIENAAMMVARNLAWQGLPTTAETVQAEVERIQSVRAELQQADVFSASQVTVAAHGEVWQKTRGTFKSGDQRFAPPALLAAVQERVKSLGGEVLMIRPDSAQTYEAAEVAKEKVIATITENLTDTTLFLDGHGGPDAFYFSDGQITEVESKQGIVVTDRTVKLSVQELADALEQRFRAQQATDGALITSNISIVFAACYMSDFVRSVASELQARGIPLPQSMIAASEYGQYAYTDTTNERGSETIHNLLETPSLGSFIEADHMRTLKGQSSNPAVFVPSPDNPLVLMQVSGVQGYEDLKERTVT